MKQSFSREQTANELRKQYSNAEYDNFKGPTCTTDITEKNAGIQGDNKEEKERIILTHEDNTQSKFNLI